MQARIGRLLTLSLSVLVLQSAAAGAQNVFERVGSDIWNAGKDVVGVWGTPFRGSADDWMLAGGVLALGAVVSVLDDDIDRWAVRNANASELGFLKELRRGGIMYGGSKIVPLAVLTYAVGVATNNQALRDGPFGCIASYASGSLVRSQVLYRLVARDRPDTARNREPGVEAPPPASHGDQYKFGFPGSSTWGEHSFPGGHVANIVSCASYLNHRFDLGFVEPVLYAVAGGVGVGRILDRGHWASDQIVGIAFGYAIGREVARRQRSRLPSGGSSDDANTASMSITPKGRGATVLLRIQF